MMDKGQLLGHQWRDRQSIRDILFSDEGFLFPDVVYISDGTETNGFIFMSRIVH